MGQRRSVRSDSLWVLRQSFSPPPSRFVGLRFVALLSVCLSACLPVSLSVRICVCLLVGLAVSVSVPRMLRAHIVGQHCRQRANAATCRRNVTQYFQRERTDSLQNLDAPQQPGTSNGRMDVQTDEWTYKRTNGLPKRTAEGFEPVERDFGRSGHIYD